MMPGEGGQSILFVPAMDTRKRTSERSPRLQLVLAERYSVSPVERSAFSRKVYDPKVWRPFRYLLFPVDLAVVTVRTWRTAKRTEARLIFSEGTYFGLAATVAAKLARTSAIWDNHGNIWGLGRTQRKGRLFVALNEALERWIARNATTMVVVSEDERLVYSSHGFEASRIKVFPTCVDLPNPISDRTMVRERYGIPSSDKAVIFFGMLGYAPNRNAAAFIAEKLAPEILRSDGTVRFLIAGGGEVPAKAEGVRFLGFVDDLDSLVVASDICVAPVWEGVGILTKVLDMLASGRPTVVTPLALTGIPELRSGDNCIVADDEKSFIDAVRKLAEDPDLADRIGRSGQRLVSEKYSWKAATPLLYAIVDEAMIKEEVRP